MSKVSVLVVAAGQGRRFGSPKQFATLQGKPLVEWSLRRFEEQEAVKEIVLVLPDPEQQGEHLSARHPRLVSIVKGGARRQDSVWNGFKELEARDDDVVLVHDGARPLVSGELIRRVIEGTSRSGAVIPVLPLEETIKEVRKDAVARTYDRARLFRVQTPQGFHYGILKKAMEAARADGYYGTDEAMLVERIGGPVSVVIGDPKNIKVTTPLDMKLAEVFLEE